MLSYTFYSYTFHCCRLRNAILCCLCIVYFLFFYTYFHNATFIKENTKPVNMWQHYSIIVNNKRVDIVNVLALLNHLRPLSLWAIRTGIYVVHMKLFAVS